MPSTRRRFVPVNVPNPQSKRHYNFKGGINTFTANEQLPDEASPYLRNKRYESRETIKTRRGPAYLSDPIGELIGAVKLDTVPSLTPLATNLVTNPSFETNTTGWSSTGAGTVARTAGGVSPGSDYLLITNSGGSGGQYTTGAVLAATAYSVSFYLRGFGNGGSGGGAVEVYIYQGATLLYSNTVNPPDDGTFQRYDYSVTSGGTTGLRIVVIPVGSGSTAGLDNVMVVAGALIDYFDGSTTDTDTRDYAWSGTAHASTSVKSSIANVTDPTLTARTISTTQRQAARFTAARTEPLSTLWLNLKTGVAGAGVVLVELWTNSGNAPGEKLATTSIRGGDIGSSYQWLPCRLLSAPELAASDDYWVVAYIQSDGGGTYLWASGDDPDTSKTSTDGLGWTDTTYALNLKTYQAPNDPVLGGIHFKQSDGTEYEVFANKTGVYYNDDGVPVQIWSGNTNATRYKFVAPGNDTLYWCDGYDAPQQWNGLVVTAVPGSPPIASDVEFHKDRLHWLSASDRTRTVFSEPGDYGTYLSVNFWYYPQPKSPDFVVSLTSQLGEHLVVRTRQTKWILYGSDLSTFTMRRATGIEGAVSADAVVAAGNFEYAVSDNGVQEYNGASDVLTSENITPDFEAISNKTVVAAVADGKYVRVYYPRAGLPYNSMAFILDLKTATWWIDDQAYFARGWVAGTELILGSSRVGQIYLADQGHNDLGAPISDPYWTKYEAYGTPEEPKEGRRFFPKFIGQVGSYTCDIYVDYDRRNSPSLIDQGRVNQQLSGDKLGSTFILGTSHLGGNGNPEPEIDWEGEFHERQFRFLHEGVDQPVELYGFSEYFLRQRAL